MYYRDTTLEMNLIDPLVAPVREIQVVPEAGLRVVTDHEVQVLVEVKAERDTDHNVMRWGKLVVRMVLYLSLIHI